MQQILVVLIAELHHIQIAWSRCKSWQGALPGTLSHKSKALTHSPSTLRLTLFILHLGHGGCPTLILACQSRNQPP